MKPPSQVHKSALFASFVQSSEQNKRGLRISSCKNMHALLLLLFILFHSFCVHEDLKRLYTTFSLIAYTFLFIGFCTSCIHLNTKSFVCILSIFNIKLSNISCIPIPTHFSKSHILWCMYIWNMSFSRIWCVSKAVVPK